MLKVINNKHVNVDLMVIRRKPYRDGYAMGDFIVEYYTQDNCGRIKYYDEYIGTAPRPLQFIDYVDKIPTINNYTSDELIIFEK